MRFSQESLNELVEDFDHAQPVTDNDGTGDSIEEKEEGTTRLATINIHGIRSCGRTQKEAEAIAQINTEIICNAAKEAKIDFLGITEPNVDFSKTSVRTCIEKGIKRIDRFARFRTTTSCIPADRVYKPGGILSIGFQGICGRVLAMDHDSARLGRWTTTRFQGNGTRSLIVVTAYMPMPSNRNNRLSISSQQENIISNPGTSANPTPLAWKDLSDIVSAIVDADNDIIVMGDLNASIYDSGTCDTALSDLCSDFGLVDAIEHRHPTTSNTPTFSKGRRIDYILCSSNIIHGIRRCGICPIGSPFISDHRTVFIDFDFERVYGKQSHTIQREGARIIQPRNSAQAGRFLETLDAMMTKKNINERCQEALSIMTKKGPFDVAARIAREADKDLRESMLMAEKKCGTIHKAPWSKKLKKAANEFQFWAFACLKFRTPPKPQVLERASKFGIDFDQTLSLQDMMIKRRACEKEMTEIRSNATTERQSMLEDDLQTALDNDDKAKATVLRRVLNAEATREAYTKLKRFKPRKSSGLTAVQVMDENGNVTTTTDPSEMNELLITEGQRHFAQAEGSPFTEGPLADIEYTADCIRARMILDGCSSFAKDDRLDEFSQRWIKHAQISKFENFSEMCVHLTRDDVKSGFAAWNVSTTTSPAGDHLGMYAALNLDMTTCLETMSEPLQKRWKQAQDRIWDSVTAIINMGASFGLTLPRWQDAVCVLIEKKPGNFLLNKLRRIFILPSDLNLALREIVGRRLIYRMEALGTMHKDLWGNRPNRSANDAALMKELIYTLARLTNTPMATFDNDAKSCYDRIVIKVAMLLARRQGLPEKTAHWIAQTMKEIKKWVQTGYGNSGRFWGHGDGSDIAQHGSLQGMTDSGALWAIISSYLAERMDEDATGIYFCSPDQKLEHQLSVVGFVDDVTQFLNFFRQYITGSMPSVKDIAEAMQVDARLWHEHIKITGGELEASKCFWYMYYPGIDKANRPRAHPLTALINEGASIALEGTDSLRTIELKAPDDAHRTLGVHKTIIGDNSEQLQISINKSKHLARLVGRAPLSIRETKMAHEMIIIPSLAYPLATSLLSFDDAHRIHSPALNACLTKMNLPRSIGRHQLHASRDFAGMQITSLPGMQAWAQIEIFTCMFRRNDEASRLARISLAWMQLVTGTEDPIWMDVDSPITYVPNNILLATRENLSRHQAQLDIWNAPAFPCLRQNDSHIMEIARRQYTSKSDLFDINLCRLYIGAITIADIATPDGRRIARDAYLLKTRNFRNSRLVWPNVSQPSKDQAVKWRRLIARHLCKPSPTQEADDQVTYAHVKKKDLQLTTELGSWIQKPLTRQLFDTLDSELGRFKLNQGRYDTPDGPTDPDDIDPKWTPWAEYDGNTEPRPRLPAIDRRPHIAHLDAFTPVSPSPPPASPWNYPFYEILELTSTMDTIILATDGSTDREHGGFGLVLATIEGTTLAKASGPTTGFDHTSFREEAAAMFEAAAMAKTCADAGSTANFHLVTDSQSLQKLITRVLKQQKPSLRRNQNEYDLIWPTILLLWPIRERVTLFWVKSHQDDDPKKILSVHATVNCQADYLADRGCKQKARIDIRPTYASPIQLRIDDEPVTRQARRKILSQTYAATRIHKVRERSEMPEKEFQKTDWSSLGKSIASFQLESQITLSRLNTDNLPIGKALHRNSRLDSPWCSSCKETCDETVPHMICCAGHLEWRMDTIKKFGRMADTNFWPTPVKNIVIKRLMAPESTPSQNDPWKDIKGIYLWRGIVPSNFPFDQFASDDPDAPSEQPPKYFIRFLFEQFLALWKGRCEKRHGKDPKEQYEIRLHRAQIRAQALREAASQYPSVEKIPSKEVLANMGLINLRSFIRWFDVLLALLERPPAAPNPSLWEDYNSFCPGHSRTDHLGVRKRHLETTC